MQVTCYTSQANFDRSHSIWVLPRQQVWNWVWKYIIVLLKIKHQQILYHIRLNVHLSPLWKSCVSNYKLRPILVLMIVRGYLCLILKPRTSLYSWFSLSSRIREKEASPCRIEHATKFPWKNHQVTSWEQCIRRVYISEGLDLQLQR